MFERYYGKSRDLLVPMDECHVFPTIDEREYWERMPADQKEALVHLGEEFLNYSWPSIPAVRYMDYARNGDRNRYTRLEYTRRSALMKLVLAECVENKGRFIDDIINGFWVIMDEASWVGPAHNSHYPPLDPKRVPLPQGVNGECNLTYVDHFAGDTGCMMAALATFIRPRLDKESPMIYERIDFELHRRIIWPFIKHEDFGWMGSLKDPHVSNWLPWCVSSCLAVTMLTNDNAFIRARAIDKAMFLVDRYMRTLPVDGGCEEGSRYSLQTLTTLCACAEIIHAMTGGKIDVFGDEKLRAFASFISKMHIDARRFTMFADADGRNITPIQCAWTIGQHLESKALQQLSLAMRPKTYLDGLHTGSMHEHAYYRLREIFTYADYAAQPETPPPYEADAWFPGIQMVMAREFEGEKNGLFFSAKGGTNGEHHNHNDIGSFVLYSDGQPAIIDMGAGDYTATSFGELRYIEHPQTASSHHNLPMVNGVQQKDGIAFKATGVAYENAGDTVRFGLNIETAYPAESGMDSWHRAFTFDRTAASLTVEDTVALNDPTENMEMVLMTAQKPVWENGVLRVPVENGRDLLVTFNEGWVPATEAVYVGNDQHFAPDWGENVYRTVYHPAKPVQNDTLTMVFTRA